jgi:hypothetical protein
MSDVMERGPVRLNEMLKCAERELAMRRNVYPKMVARMAMDQSHADRETILMQNIVDYLKADLEA